MKKKITLLLTVLCIFVLVSAMCIYITTNLNSDDSLKVATSNEVVEEFIDVDIILTNRLNADRMVNMEKVENISYLASDIIIAEVVEVKPSDNYYSHYEEYGLAYTPSIIQVKSTIKGDIEEDSTVEIRQDGGTITIAKYELSLDNEQKAKFNSNLTISEAEKQTKYITEGFADSASIVEQGQTYLFFLKTDRDGSLVVLSGPNSVQKVGNTSAESEQINAQSLEIKKDTSIEAMSTKMLSQLNQNLQAESLDKDLEESYKNIIKNVTALKNNVTDNKDNVLYRLKLIELAHNLEV